MKHMKILSVLFAAAGFAVTACGDDNSSGAKGVGNSVDRAFITDMVAHHQSAVEMAKIAQKRPTSAFVKQLADDIVRTQNEEIELLRGEDEKLEAAGVAKGSLGVAEHMMGIDGDMASLKTAKPFDKAFISMMIPHHEGAVTMAKAELSKGKDPKLKVLAQDIITAQQREVAAMRKHLGGAGSDMSEETHGGHSG